MKQSLQINSIMANVIEFPNKNIRKNHPDLSNEQRTQLLLSEKIDKVETSLEYVTIEMMSLIHRLGFDLVREDMVKDVTFILDATRSLMYRSSGLEHPLQSFVDEKYILKGRGGEEYAYCPEFDPEAKDDNSED